MKKITLCIIALAVLTALTQEAQAQADPPGGTLIPEASEIGWGSALPISNGIISMSSLLSGGSRGTPADCYRTPLTPGGGVPGLVGSEYSLRVQFRPRRDDLAYTVLNPYYNYTNEWNDDLLKYPPGGPIKHLYRPSVVIHIYFNLEDIPALPNADGGNWSFGLRITGWDQFQREFWPGLLIGWELLSVEASAAWTGPYLGTYEPGGRKKVPYFSYRGDSGNKPIMPIPAGGWWTLGLSWDDEGIMHVYAAQGRVPLTEADLIAVDEGYHYNGTYYYNELLRSFKAVFLAFRQPADESISSNWLLGSILVYHRPPKKVLSLASISGDYKFFDLALTDLMPGASYEILNSGDLSQWELVYSFTATARTMILPVIDPNTIGFYEIRPAP